MVSPAKIEGQKEVLITNNLKNSAEYTVTSECATVTETSFELDPAEIKRVEVTPKCNGYLQVKEETDTVINRFNILLSSEDKGEVKNKEKKSLALPITVLVLASSALSFAVWKITRKGGREA